MDMIAGQGDHELYVMANEDKAIACLIPGKITANDWIKLRLTPGNTYTIMWVNLGTAEAKIVKTGHRSSKWIAFSPPEFVVGHSGLVMLTKEP